MSYTNADDELDTNMRITMWARYLHRFGNNILIFDKVGQSTCVDFHAQTPRSMTMKM